MRSNGQEAVLKKVAPKNKKTVKTYLPEDLPVDQIHLFALQIEPSKENELQQKCKKLLFSIHNDTPMELAMFQKQLPYALELCRSMTQWEGEITEETGALVSNLMYYLQDNIEPFTLKLTKSDVEHIHSLSMLCSILDDAVLRFEGVDKVLEVHGGRPALEYLSEQAKLQRAGSNFTCF